MLIKEKQTRTNKSNKQPHIEGAVSLFATRGRCGLT